MTKYSAISILKSGVHATFLRLSSTAFGLVFGIIAARLAGAANFGEYVSTMALIGILVTLGSLGLPQVLAREISIARGTGEKRRVQATINLATTMLAFLAVAACTSIYAGIPNFAVGFSYIIGAISLSVITAVFNGSEKVIWGMWLNCFIRPGLALAILCAVSIIVIPSTTTLFATQLFAILLALCVALAMIRNEEIFRLPWPTLVIPRWKASLGNIVQTGSMLAVTQMLIGLTTQIDILILTVFSSPEEVSHYYAAARAALVISFFSGSTALVVEPTITRYLASENSNDAQKLIHRTAVGGFVVALFAFLFVVAFSDLYLDSYGPSFTEAKQALYIMSGGFVLYTLFGPAEVTLRAARKDASNLIIVGIALIANIFVSVLLVFKLGILGVAIGSVVQFTLHGCLMMLKARHLLNIETNIKSAVLGC